jgi:hypothetical protein
MYSTFKKNELIPSCNIVKYIGISQKLFKTYEIGPGRFPKVASASAVLLTFKKKLSTYLSDLKTGEIGPGGFQKLSGSAE